MWWIRRPIRKPNLSEVGSIWDRLHAHGVVQCDGMNDVWPYRAPTQYDGYSSVVKFGAFLSWPDGSSKWSVFNAIANRLDRLSEKQRAALGLVDIDHQASGHSCSQHAFIARPIQIAPEMLPFAERLCARFYHAHGGWFIEGEEFGLTAQFDAEVRAAGLVPYAHSAPQRQTPVESIYPIAATVGNIRRFVSDHRIVMRQLAPLFGDPFLRSDLFILILAENSD